MGGTVKRSCGPRVATRSFIFNLRETTSSLARDPLFTAVSTVRGTGRVRSKCGSRDRLKICTDSGCALRVGLTTTSSSFLRALSATITVPYGERFFGSAGNECKLSLGCAVFGNRFILADILRASCVVGTGATCTNPSPTGTSSLALGVINSSRDITSGLMDKCCSTTCLEKCRDSGTNGGDKVALIPCDGAA